MSTTGSPPFAFSRATATPQKQEHLNPRIPRDA
jgi:hypothetical protein